MSLAATLRQSVGQIARDAALPQLPRLLDPEVVAPVLARSLGRDIAGARIAYVIYEPEENVIVRYEVTADGKTHDAVVFADAEADLAAWAVAPDHLELARKATHHCPAAEPLTYDAKLDALVHWLPLDLALPALAETPERLRTLIEEAGVKPGPDDELPHRIGYKPRRQANLRLGRHFVKIYGKQPLFARAVRNLRAAESLPIRTARSEAVIPELRVAVQSLLEGQQPARSAEVARQAGALLPALHTATLDGLRVASPEYWLRNVEGSASVIAAIAPRLRPRVEALLRKLELRLEKAVLVPCHVDFFARQLIELDGQYGLIDFDRMSMAAPALDLATFVSDLVQSPTDLSRASADLDVLCESYGTRPPGIPWYLTVVLLRRARNPFLHFVDGWPDQVEQRLAAAEAAVHLE